MTSLRTLLSLAVAAVLAAPVAAGAAVTATTISEPVTDPSVLVFVEPAGLALTVSGTSNGGIGRLDLRCEGAATAVVDGNVRPTAAGVWTTTLSAATVSRLTAAHLLPARGAPRQRRAPISTAFAGKRIMFQRSRVTAVVGGPNNGVPYDFRYWAPQLLGRSIWQSVSNCGLEGASTIAPTTFHVSASAFPCAGFIAPTTVRARRRARRSRQRVHALRGRHALQRLGQRARPARLADLRLDRPEHGQRADPRDREPAALQPRRRHACPRRR